jgi:hypothetical protein
VMRAEQQLQAVGEQGPDVSLGAAAVTAVHGGKRPGKAPFRRLALLRPVSASRPEFASAQDDHLLRSRGSALLKSTPADRKEERDGTCDAIVGRYGGRRMRSRPPAVRDRFILRTGGVSPLARQHRALGRAFGEPTPTEADSYRAIAVRCWPASRSVGCTGTGREYHGRSAH